MMDIDILPVQRLDFRVFPLPWPFAAAGTAGTLLALLLADRLLFGTGQNALDGADDADVAGAAAKISR